MNAAERVRPILDPIDRLSEIVFGLLMALSFTGTISVAASEGEQVGSVLMAALGCNVAWGIVDGVMFVLATAVERARRISYVEAIRTEPFEQARQIFLDNLPEDVRLSASDELADAIFKRIRASQAAGHGGIVRGQDLIAAASICALVIASTLPPSIPFMFIDDLPIAMRVSNATAIVMLFAIGARLGKYMGRSPWPMALVMATIGSVLVAITIALGG